MSENRRWYDDDPLLKEAMELLRLSPANLKGQAAEYLIQLQDQVARDVIEKVYDTAKTYFKKGSRWYDNDPVVIRGIELLKNAPSHIQKEAAKKLIAALQEDPDSLDSLFEEEESLVKTSDE